jgi:hypothetical protein
MEIWNKSGMWPFSTFAFVKDVRSLPGLDDMSMEEVRYFAYESMAAGDFNRYLTWVKQLTQDYETKRRHLMKPSGSLQASLISVIEEIINTDALQGCVTAAGQKVSDAIPPTFAGVTAPQPAAATAGGFGFSAVNSSPAFDAAASIPGATVSVPLQGFAVPDAGAMLPFSTAPSSISAQSSGGFGPSSISSPSSGGFNVHKSAPTVTFGQHPPQQQILFGKPVDAVPSSHGFAQQPPAVFGSAKPSMEPPSFGFGDPSVVSSSRTHEPTAYTPLDQLTSDERAAFESSSFTLGCIPLRPPPKELI